MFTIIAVALALAKHSGAGGVCTHVMHGCIRMAGAKDNMITYPFCFLDYDSACMGFVFTRIPKF